MRQNMRCVGILTVLILWCASPVLAEEVGTLMGVVSDSASGKPIVSAQIRLEGTDFGAITNDSGFYQIPNISPGEYNVGFHYLGYSTIRIENVRISHTKETIQNAILAEREVAITVDFPPLVPTPDLSSVTGVNHIITADESSNLPTRGYTEPTGLMPGAMQPFGSNNVHNAGVSIRSGYADETWYYVDGIAQRDPATGTPITFINNNYIDKVAITNSACNAAYGQASGGAVDVGTLKPQQSWHSTFEAVSDNFHGENYDYNVYSATLSGPLIPNSRRLYLSGALERGWYGDVAPRPVAGGMLPHHSSGLWNWQGKLDWRLSHEMHLTAGTMGSDLDARLFSQAFHLTLSMRRDLHKRITWHGPNFLTILLVKPSTR
ncbi:carboxypeptidase regulatory-like domain-containing protein [Candidatus Zixiibacteriota bacterium]